MDADRKHVLENRLRRLNMHDAGFGGPGAESRNVDALADGDGKVLVPGNFPVGVGRLVEEQAANSERGGAEDRAGKVVDGGRVGEFTDSTDGEKITQGVGVRWGIDLRRGDYLDPRVDPLGGQRA